MTLNDTLLVKQLGLKNSHQLSQNKLLSFAGNTTKEHHLLQNF